MNEYDYKYGGELYFWQTMRVYMSGKTYRLLVVDGRLCSVHRSGVPAPDHEVGIPVPERVQEEYLAWLARSIVN